MIGAVGTAAMAVLLMLAGRAAAQTPTAQSTQVFTAFAAPRTDTTARLNGYVNPEGSEAAYHFSYSRDGVSWTVLPNRVTVAANRQIVVAQEVEGLQPDTTYHYRISVSTAAGEALPPGEDKTFRTRKSSEMVPPERGDELVNRADKGNQNVLVPSFFQNQSPTDESGTAVLWTVLGSAPGGNSPEKPLFVARRTASGWHSEAVIPPAADQIGEGELLYQFNEANPSFTRFLFRASQSWTFSEGPPTFVLVDDEGGQRALASFPEDHTPRAWLNTEATDDLQHVFMVNRSTLQLEDLISREVASIMPDNTASACGVPLSAGFSGVEDQERGSASQWRIGYDRIDEINGARVYFQSVPNGTPCDSAAGIFSRDLQSGVTTAVDDGSGPAEPTMIRASGDGSVLYFVTATAHTPDDTNGSGDVYRWSADSHAYSCLTCVVANAEVGTEEPVVVSDDLTHVYFSSDRDLVPGHGQPGDTKIYELSGGTVRFVGDVGIESVLNSSSSYVSGNGNVLLFEASQPHGVPSLTADPFAAASCRQPANDRNGPCLELYRYEASTESLECISCGPSGGTEWATGTPDAQSVVLSKDGQTVAFSSQERLAAEDVNRGYDVYEWNHGRRRPITDGATQFPSQGAFLAPRPYGMDASGENIFFTVDDPDLTGYEEDGFVNLYDARVGGGFPRPQPISGCSEEGCQGPLQPNPAPPSIGSVSFNGGGNLAKRPPRRCRRGKGRRGRHCSRRRSRHRHAHHHHRPPRAGHPKRHGGT